MWVNSHVQVWEKSLTSSGPVDGQVGARELPVVHLVSSLRFQAMDKLRLVYRSKGLRRIQSINNNNHHNRQEFGEKGIKKAVVELRWSHQFGESFSRGTVEVGVNVILQGAHSDEDVIQVHQPREGLSLVLDWISLVIKELQKVIRGEITGTESTSPGEVCNSIKTLEFFVWSYSKRISLLAWRNTTRREKSYFCR